ncbi:hypothetical protein WHR41_08325 [Cladosporium halotolerans]|uniref:Mitochondrial import inner membrane translocase subunit n=1 Tax=Cladosporium halotolerans TaxID=1052096 RepID=A0AB34KF50_9PEZI
MDQLQISAETQQGLQNLSAKDKQELNQFVVGETQKAQIQSTIHELNSVCFKKCITGRMSSGSLERNEDSCMKNCVDRYMDASMLVVKNLEKMR